MENKTETIEWNKCVGDNGDLLFVQDFRVRAVLPQQGRCMNDIVVQCLS